jgi:hypothetical protein
MSVTGPGSPGIVTPKVEAKSTDHSLQWKFGNNQNYKYDFMVRATVDGAPSNTPEAWSAPTGFRVRADVCNSCHATKFSSVTPPDI